MKKCLVMILLFALRHNLTYEAISDLLNLLNLITPTPNKIPKSLWLFRQLVEKRCTKAQQHLYCSVCQDNISNCTLSLCPTCGTNLVTSPPGNFSTLSIENQLQSLFKSMFLYYKSLYCILIMYMKEMTFAKH